MSSRTAVKRPQARLRFPGTGEQRPGCEWGGRIMQATPRPRNYTRHKVLKSKQKEFGLDSDQMSTRLYRSKVGRTFVLWRESRSRLDKIQRSPLTQWRITAGGSKSLQGHLENRLVCTSDMVKIRQTALRQFSLVELSDKHAIGRI
jgi:hypothetical protein